MVFVFSFPHYYLVFIQSKVDSCLYKTGINACTTLLAIYVEDLLIASNSDKDSVELQNSLLAEFPMKTLGFPENLLGVAQSEKV